MTNKYKYLVLLGLFNTAFAVNQASAPLGANQNSSSSVSGNTVKPLTVNNAVLQQADDDYAKLQALKRQAAIKEQQDKLTPKIISNVSSNGNKSGGIGETVVTNVVIDSHGTNFATLQFSDGSSLNVEPGTRIGKYTVSSIDLTGVRITSCSNHHKCGKGILIKRAYPVTPKSTMQSAQSTAIFTPQGSDGNSNSSVPPLSKVN